MQRQLLGLLLVSSLFGCGCGEKQPPLGALSGQVTQGGQPVTAARIHFENAEQGTGTFVELDAEGKFTLSSADGPGLPPGKYQVAIKPQGSSLARPASGDLPPEALAGSSAAQEPPPVNPLLPAKYHSFATSGLSIDLQAGANPAWEIKLDSE